MLLRLVVAALLATVAHGWILMSQDVYGASIDTIRAQLNGIPNSNAPQAQLGELWSMNLPGTTPDSWSMGGGITWAWDDAMCEPLMERFSERLLTIQFITCDDAKSAVNRAFNKWASNNRYLKFNEVTEDCRHPPYNVQGAARGKLVSTPDESFTYHDGCALAEIFVSFLQGDEVREDVIQVAVAQAYSKDVSSNANTSMVFTNGEQPYKRHTRQDSDGNVTSWRTYDDAPFFATYAGSLKFDVTDRNCWYLDSAFCSRFHEFKDVAGSAENGRMIIQLICWGITVLSLLSLICLRCGIIRICKENRKRRKMDRDGDGKLDMQERFLYLLEEISTWNPLVLAVIWCSILAPPLVLYYIFLPCWDCSDFEAAALHEIGHLLGLGHPDKTPDGLHPSVLTINTNPVANQSYNAWLASGGKVNASNCHSLWDDVFYGVPAGLPATQYIMGSNNYETRPSVMQAFTKNNPRACLEDDDVDALAMMYPDCGVQGTSVNICHKVNHNIGLVRLMVYVLLPLFISLIVIMCLSGIASNYLNKELEEARMNAEALEHDLSEQRETVKKNARRGSSIFQKKVASLQATQRVGGAALERSASGRIHVDAVGTKLMQQACTSKAAAAILSKRTTITTVDHVFEAGPIGIILKTGSNYIKRIENHSQAEAQNIVAGGTLTKVNGESIAQGTALQAISAVPRPVTVTVMYQGSKAVKHKDDGTHTTTGFPLQSSGSGISEPNSPTFVVAAQPDVPTDGSSNNV